MKRAIMEQWVSALRSGAYKQTKQRLKCGNGFCCLGVLSDLAMVEGICDYSANDEYDGQEALTPSSVMKWAGIKDDNGIMRKGTMRGTSLTSLNDDEGMSFKQIADVIEKNWRHL